MSLTAGSTMRSRDGFSATSNGAAWVPDTKTGITRSTRTGVNETHLLADGK